jgi:hypothetical protein
VLIHVLVEFISILEFLFTLAPLASEYLKDWESIQGF